MKLAYVVDDNVTYHQVMQAHLTQLGYQVKAFLNAKDCLKVMTTKPDLILLDQNLGPDEKGIDYLKEFNRMAPGIPIVFLTADGDVYTATKALKMGAFDYIEKNGAALVRLRTALDGLPAYAHKQKWKRWLKMGAIIVWIIALAAIGFAMTR